ncbi:electron transfer flavoprotein subunit beta/FixA family protein [Brevibacillus marinus]|uniref:electron transfer flavoprotein subunit beta/FixA family protein n=1 Tax=Brevibacillus marinus TaxID=2496837 RepID=UPI000F844FA0|nr:electron transfer flavoprotein subunit beta/FixA family protein [Brevibacillus marinus]
MNICVLIKQTFDTEERIAIQNGKINEEGVEFIINPYDEYAIEEAVQLKEAQGAIVTVLTVGPARAESALRKALAMGADQAVLIETEDEAIDEYSIAKLIAAYVKDKGYDLILGGNMAIDSGSGQVAVRVAEELGIAHVSAVTKLNWDGSKAIVERDVEGDVEVVEVNLPFLATAQQGLNEPRYPSLPGLMKAKKKPLERLTIAELGLAQEEWEARTAIREQYLPARKQAGKILDGDLSQQVRELVQLLRSEAKVV